MGTFLIVLGAIVAVLTGGCTLMFFAGSGFNDPFAPVALVFGGIPFLVGIGLLFIGLAVNKHKIKRENEAYENQ
jgi:hypothetical protein